MPKFRLLVLVLLTIVLICGIFYYNSLHNPFIWDDDGLIVKHPLIRSLTNLSQAFTTDLYFGSNVGSNFYRPLQTLSYMFDYYFWQLDPFGFHLTNIILQILVSFFVFLFARSILNHSLIAFFAALLFAVNPIHTEAVTYISGRADMLMSLFLILALLLFIRRNLVLSWMAFVLALLSRELAVVFPLVIIAYLFYYRRKELKSGSSFVRLVLPFILIDLIYVFLRATYLNFNPLRPAALAKYTFLERLSVLPEVIFTYFRLLLSPVNLHMSWSLKPAAGFSFFVYWFLLGIICAGVVYIVRKSQAKNFSFMLFWFLAFLLPQSGIFPINAFVAEHFIYLSSISFFMLVAYLLNKYLSKSVFIFTATCLIIIYGLLTLNRNLEWHDPLTFYSKIIKFSPQSFQAHNNLGLVYEQMNLYPQAICEYKKALQIYPQLIEARSNLANVYYKTGKFKEARDEYAIVEKSVPASKIGELQNNIGCIYEVEGSFNEALDRFRLALKYDPKLNFAHLNIAKIYIRQSNLDLAAIQILQSLPEIAGEKANKNDYLRVIAEYIKSLKNINCAISFYNNLGLSFAAAGYLDASSASFSRALDLDPRYADAHFNLGLVYLKTGDKRKAIFELKSALKINPNHLQAKELLYKINRRK
ncbi:MAG: tetratricopeptide repeat protein [Candidatus Omnitrophica bacterium]|nr:tetratricopeptide repeat protein [Candidatus Omnitrophota bacterium]